MANLPTAISTPAKARAKALKPKSGGLRPTVVFCEPRKEARQELLGVFREGDVERIEVDSEPQLREVLARQSEITLVFLGHAVAGKSSLSLLAELRGEGCKVPFVILTAHHDSFVRVLISDAQGSVLSSRVLSSARLAELVLNLWRQAAH